MARYSTQIAIVGGGICGLWLLNILRARGIDAWLFEKGQLGQAQTLASQGMIHGGIKYTLEGFKTPASETIANMPETWRACFAGDGPIDLRSVPVLSEDYFLFSDARITSRLTAFFASKSVAGRITSLARSDYPGALDHPDFKGNVYRLQDLVIDTGALLTELASRHADVVYRANVTTQIEDNQVQVLKLDDGTEIVAQHYIFCAGSGNQQLVSHTALDHVAMQTRPLQQVMIKGDLPPLYAHAVSLGDAAKPRVTISSHPTRDGKMVWYLGGNLAERGVGVAADELINRAKLELKSLLPWIDLTSTLWSTLRIDRAEPAQEQVKRPDHPFVESAGNTTVCWPTKLTLTPMLADMVIAQVDLAPDSDFATPPDLPRAIVAPAPWEQAFA